MNKWTQRANDWNKWMDERTHARWQETLFTTIWKEEKTKNKTKLKQINEWMMASALTTLGNEVRVVSMSVSHCEYLGNIYLLYGCLSIRPPVTNVLVRWTFIPKSVSITLPTLKDKLFLRTLLNGHVNGNVDWSIPKKALDGNIIMGLKVVFYSCSFHKKILIKLNEDISLHFVVVWKCFLHNWNMHPHCMGILLRKMR